MNRDQIIETTGCPKCDAKVNQPCRNHDGSARKANHVERLYRAQDIEAGKPDRVTGEINHDHLADRRCPICHKVLKTRQGANDHMVGAHGYTRAEAKKARKEYQANFTPKTSIHHPSRRNASDDFDVLEDF